MKNYSKQNYNPATTINKQKKAPPVFMMKKPNRFESKKKQ